MAEKLVEQRINLAYCGLLAPSSRRSVNSNMGTISFSAESCSTQRRRAIASARDPARKLSADRSRDPRGSQGISRGIAGGFTRDIAGDLMGTSMLSPLVLGISRKKGGVAQRNRMPRLSYAFGS